MPDDELPRDADFHEVNSSLNESLKTCRTMVADYRAFLSSDDGARTDADKEPPDEPDGFETGSNGH